MPERSSSSRQVDRLKDGSFSSSIVTDNEIDPRTGFNPEILQNPEIADS
jgi:hypothetical protein